MTDNSRSPAFVILDYHTPYAPHKQQFCINNWFPVSSGHDMGTVTAHDASTADLKAMIDDLLGTMSVFALPDTVWDLATVFTQAAPTGPAFPQASYVPTQVGTSVGAAPRKATEITVVMHTVAFGICKMVLLDVPVNTNFEQKLPGDFSSADNAFIAEFGDPVKGWVGQDGSKPNAGIRITYNLNQKLRKEYRMV
jgi:hypothetical protein